MIAIEGNTIRVETRTLRARLERGELVSLVRLTDGREMLRRSQTPAAPLELVYAGSEAVPLGDSPGDAVTTSGLSEHRAEVRVESWNGDGVIGISEDPESGDLLIEPSGYSSRPGLRACRWSLRGIDPSLELVAPFFQGVRLPLEDPLIRDTHWSWPHSWEAGLAVLQGADGGTWVHCRDTRYRYKALRVGSPSDPRCLGLETESYGPLERSLAAGGLTWRINVHRGDWRKPAGRYRDWLTASISGASRRRPAWVEDLKLAVSWCPCEPAILDALAARRDPRTILLHVPQWRSDPYDEGYPTYEANPAVAALLDAP